MASHQLIDCLRDGLPLRSVDIGKDYIVMLGSVVVHGAMGIIRLHCQICLNNSLQFLLVEGLSVAASDIALLGGDHLLQLLYLSGGDPIPVVREGDPPDCVAAGS